jgi:Ca2+-binding RTX toxin-like protein
MADFNGSSDDDIFTGGSDPDTAAGNGGNDQLSGGGGNDAIAGNAGADTLNGDGGDDRLYSADNIGFITFPYFDQPYTPPVFDIGTEVDTLNGGAGDDRIFVGYGDNADGGTHTTFGDKLFISLLGAPAGVTVDFDIATLVIGGGTITGFEHVSWIQGSNFDDDINVGSGSGNGYSDFTAVYGMGGNDRLVAGYYTGSMFGGEGNDILDGRGSQYLFRIEGDAGDDTIYTRSNGITSAYGGDGNDIIYSHADTHGGAGNDLIILQNSSSSSFVYIYGEAGDDEIRASASGNNISGGAGADLLTGADGNDILASGDFLPFSTTAIDDMGLERDTLAGAGGNDKLSAGYGDNVDGGSGSDTLALSLGGLAAGIAFDTAGIASGLPFAFAGGTIQNVETLSYLRGSEFADTLSLATQATLLTVDAGAGDDLVISHNSSASVSGGLGDDRFVSGIAGDIWDGGAGVDTLDYQNYGSAVTVSLGLAAGSTGSGAGGDSLRNIENVDGSASGDTIGGSDQDNVLRGFAGNDSLSGNGGADVLIGGGGDDAMAGGTGNDIFYVEDAGDSVSEAAGQGNDRVVASLSYALAGGAEVEQLELLDSAGTDAMDLTGSNFANTIIGNAGINTLRGEGGNDFLVGGGGTDLMYGGTGNDTYYVDNGGDVVVEAASEGNDRIATAVSYVLAIGAEVEQLEAINSAATGAMDLTGNIFANTITGNAGVNILRGEGGNDILAGLAGNDFLIGGAGADFMYGGTGDDTYYVDDAGDQTSENAGQGTDRIATSISYALLAGSEIELLEGVTTTDTNAMDLTGSNFANAIIGNAGANILRGEGGNDTLTALGGNDFLVGGTGADLMYGGTGDDTYYVDNLGDQANEAAGEGTDRIATSISFALQATSEVELLETVNTTDTSAMDLTGSDFANAIIGSNGVNILRGEGGNDTLTALGGNDFLVGGAGNDAMFGGTGNDTYYVDSALDTVAEAAGQGNDRIATSVSYTLAAGSEVETLEAITRLDTNAMNLTGNATGNTITGNDGANILDGKGGSDLLVGYGGVDTFAFTTALGSGNVGNIADFVIGTDKLALDHAVFAGLGLGALPAGAFTGGLQAQDADDRILYDQTTGLLLFDADGNGAGQAVLFATLLGAPPISAGDFIVI